MRWYNLNFTYLLNPKEVYEESQNDLVKRIAEIKSQKVEEERKKVEERIEENIKHETIDK